MPLKTINAVDMMDRGIFLSTPSVSTPVKPLLPGDVSKILIKEVKRVDTADPKFNKLVSELVAAKTPEEIASSMIKARYQSLGGARGVLGGPVSNITICPDRIGFFQHYKKNGSIYWNPSTGAHEVHGAIRKRWSGLGWERSFLGYPTTGEKKGCDTQSEGFFNHFEGGSLYWHPSTGAHEVHGAIRQKYLELGAEGSFLGYPTTDELRCPDRRGRFNHFQAGSIYWTKETWAHEVHGLIRNYWAQNGWERNPALGYPLTDELVPHRQMGFIRPPSIRKPIKALPLDVIRLPDEQPSPTLMAIPDGQRISTLNTIEPSANIASSVFSPTKIRVLAVSPSSHESFSENSMPPGAVNIPTSLSIRPIATHVTLPAAVLNPVAKQKDHSQNRYSDFENGVVFWRRGSSRAEMLEPRAIAPDGTKMAWTGHEVAAIAGITIRRVLSTLPGAQILAIPFTGTKSYNFDGAGIHNRSHRLHVILQGMIQQGFFPKQGIARVEILAEVSFDPLSNRIVGHLTKWDLIASEGDFLGGGSLIRNLNSRLDPALWEQFSVAKLSVTATTPATILSVKTKADGNVVVYFEP